MDSSVSQLLTHGDLTHTAALICWSTAMWVVMLAAFLQQIHTLKLTWRTEQIKIFLQSANPSEPLTLQQYNRRNCADLFYKKPCSLYTGCGLMGWPSLNGSDTSSFSEVVLNTLPDRGFICRGQSQYSVSVTRILYYFKKLFVSWHVLW